MPPLPKPLSFPDFYGNPHNPDISGWRLAWRDEHLQGVTFAGASPALGLREAVLPRDLRDPSWYARAGRAGLGEGDIADARSADRRQSERRRIARR